MHVVANRRAAGNTHLSGDERMLPDDDAMRNLDEIVDLGARMHARLADRGPVNRRVRANFDVIFDDDGRPFAGFSRASHRRASANPNPSLPITAPS